MRSRGGERRQRGVALLTAVLLVAFGTIIATAIAFQSALTARRGAAVFAFDQSLALAQAAEALAAYALREDLKSQDGARFDHDREEWARPFGPVEVVPGVALEASLEDMQGRFNLNSLVGPDRRIDEDAVEQFQRLLAMLELEEKWAWLIADWIDADINPSGFQGAEDTAYLAQTPGYRTSNRVITSTTELLALPDFGRERFLKLAPYVTALPHDAKLNLCSAEGVVLDAAFEWATGERSFSADSEVLAKNRENGCFPQKDRDFLAAIDPSDPAYAKVQDRVQETSSYFRLTSIVTVGTTQFALYSLLYRDGNGRVRPILRTYAAE